MLEKGRAKMICRGCKKKHGFFVEVCVIVDDKGNTSIGEGKKYLGGQQVNMHCLDPDCDHIENVYLKTELIIPKKLKQKLKAK
jgi:hypothetical protein